MKVNRHAKIIELIGKYHIETQEELADYLGVARPSLSRALMRMQKEGMIEAGKNQIKIIDREKLENFSN